MSDDRKYKQHGYQDDDRRPSASAPAPGRSGERPSTFAAYKEAVKCDACGTELATQFEIRVESRCPKCRAELHTCRNCLHLDPSAPFECTEPVEQRVPGKAAGNDCPLFSPRKVRVKETTFSSAPRPEDARKALEDLFRKK
jgi:hypothetical protein